MRGIQIKNGVINIPALMLVFTLMVSPDPFRGYLEAVGHLISSRLSG